MALAVPPASFLSEGLQHTPSSQSKDHSLTRGPCCLAQVADFGFLASTSGSPARRLGDPLAARGWAPRGSTVSQWSVFMDLLAQAHPLLQPATAPPEVMVKVRSECRVGSKLLSLRDLGRHSSSIGLSFLICELGLTT